MRHILLLFAALTAIAWGQSEPRNLKFQEGEPGAVPPGWFAPKAISGFGVKLVADGCKSGKYCAEVAFAGGATNNPFGNIMQVFDATAYRGKRIRFRAAVKTSAEPADGHAQMWIRVDRTDHSMGFFENMSDRPIHVPDWQYFEITGDIDTDASRLNIGLMLFGKGKAWLDDVSVDILSDTPVMPSYVVPPSAAFDKLTEAAKLWVYVKYLHPRVTMPGVDWDKAFVDAVPKILESKTDDDFAAAINAMMAPLHDPYTRAVNPAREKTDDRNVPMIMPGQEGVVVVGMTAGDRAQFEQAIQSVSQQIRSAKAVVFDVRGSRSFNRNFRIFSFATDGVFPSTLKRVHNGYANQMASGYQGYSSYWRLDEGEHVAKSAMTGIRPVFLVNSETIIPDIAVMLQDTGGCAIVSEDEISDAQTHMGEAPLHAGNLSVQIRTKEFERADGTSGLTANVVLDKRGDAALQAAIELARSGNWPKPMVRTRFARPSPVYTERSHPQTYPPTELRVMAAATVWGVFNYFHPYKYLYGEDWDSVLAEFLPKMAAAKDARQYALGVAEMVAHTHDTHCYVNSNELTNARGGGASPPVEVRWIENQPVVTRVTSEELAAQIHPGDVVTKINGDPVQKRIDELAPSIAASTPQSLHQRIMQMLLNSQAGSEPTVTFRGADGSEHAVSLSKTRGTPLYPARGGEIYRLLNRKIGYVDLERLNNSQVDAMFDTFQNTDWIIMDMRGYPQGTAWTIAPRLADAPGKVNAQFRTNIVTAGIGRENDVRSEIFEQKIPVTGKSRYQGRTILLIDDRAISQSEHSGLMYKTANGTVFIGSPTTGANGDVTGFMVPGGIRIPFSGHDVRWPDGRQLQRVGLVPDIEAHPTIEGIRAGRDEILERAVAYAETGK
ncbi:MAG TPA: S41 family peptidase [Bryobacteraceae bacterium]|jgi:C-terminal processing protease CtpA/Prc